MSYVLFSIDRVDDLYTLSKFLRHVDTNRAMKKMQGEMKLCFGSWQGVIEQSFIMRQDDYDTFVKPYGFTDQQESVLLVPEDTRQPCVLVYGNGTKMGIGPMREVSKEDAMAQAGWTYRPDLGLYFVA